MFTDEEYSKEADTVGLGRARPPRSAGRAKRSLDHQGVLSLDHQGVLVEQKGP